MAKYYATFSANGGSTYSAGAYEYTNKTEANNDIRDIAMSETFEGNTCSWRVEDENGKTVFEGRYFVGVGIRYTVKNYKYIY